MPTKTYVIRFVDDYGQKRRSIVGESALESFSQEELRIIETCLLGFGQPQFKVLGTKRAFWTQAQAESYVKGLCGEPEPAGATLDDMHYLGRMDAQLYERKNL